MFILSFWKIEWDSDWTLNPQGTHSGVYSLHWQIPSVLVSMVIERKLFWWPRIRKISEQILAYVVFAFTHVNLYEHKRRPNWPKPRVAAWGSGFGKGHGKLRSLTVHVALPFSSWMLEKPQPESQGIRWSCGHCWNLAVATVTISALLPDF